MAQKPALPKGTRDFNANEISKRNYIVEVCKKHFKQFGFEPIETPSFEKSSTLMGKYGDEGDRLIFKILDSGEFFEKLKESINDFEFTNKVFDDFLERLIDFTKKEEVDLKRYELDETYRIKIKYSLIANNELIKFTKGYFKNRKTSIYSMFQNVDLAEEIISELLGQMLDTMVRLEPEKFRMSGRVLFNEKIKNKFFENINLSSSTISKKALRYDLTVPFARYVVQHQHELNFPFKRYQIQPVWRADRPQKGRFREFYQCDADVVGSDSLWQEVEFVQLYDEVFNELNLSGATIKINNRKVLSGIAEIIGESDKLVDFTVALDKLDKIGKTKVTEEMLEKGISESAIKKLNPIFELDGNIEDKINKIKNLLLDSEIGQKGVEELRFVIQQTKELGLKSCQIDFDVTLARGLNYYTGAIFEVSAPEGVKMGSIGGGGRYDDLTGIFGLKNLSGVGVSFGLDRIYLVIEALNLFPKDLEKNNRLLFINFGENEAGHALKIIQNCRAHNVSAELYPDSDKMKKQMTYADKNAFQYVALLGGKEIENETLGIKNMITGEQHQVPQKELIDFILSKLNS